MQRTYDWDDHDDHDKPKFGKKAHAWLRRRIRQELFEDFRPIARKNPFKSKSDGRLWEIGAVDIALDFYMARWDRYVRWVDADVFHGPRYAYGGWTFVAAFVTADFGDAELHVHRTLDAERIQTLDDWLKADIAGTLLYWGDPGGMEKVPADLRYLVQQTAKCRARRDARRAADVVPNRECACRTCGETFQARCYNSRNCPACCVKNRQHREETRKRNRERHEQVIARIEADQRRRDDQ